MKYPGVSENGNGSITLTLPEYGGSEITIPKEPKLGDPLVATLPDGSQQIIEYGRSSLKITSVDPNGVMTVLETAISKDADGNIVLRTIETDFNGKEDGNR